MGAPRTSNGHFTKHAIAVDVVLFTIQDGTLKVLLVKRRHTPYRNTWSLPGGVVGVEESVDAAALRAHQPRPEPLSAEPASSVPVPAGP